MSIFMKFISVVCVLIGAFLVYAVIHAAASAGGARVGVAIGYVAGAILLSAVATLLWRRSSARRARTAQA